MAEPQAGYQIKGKFYPFPASFRLGDPVLIRELTGLSWGEFVDAMPDDDDPEAIGDPIVMLGMLGVAVAQANPTWRRERIVTFVQRINIEDVEAVGVDEEEGVEDEGDAGPPVATNGSNPSEKTATESRSDSDSTSESSSLKPSGSQPLATTPK